MAEFSLITPTHNTEHILRLYDSIKAQTKKCLEWVIVPNNGADISIIPKEPWIKIIPLKLPISNIGAIKNFAFNLGVGDYLVEVDHDDELTPDCLEELNKRIIEKSPDFLYSDAVSIDRNLNPLLFSSDNGWKTATFNINGKDVLYNKSFDPHPLTFSKIWYAPNHVRVWKTEFYKKIGGHNPLFKALDDQDLMSRTYIFGTVEYIKKPLYIYHLHNANSYRTTELNSWIQETTIPLYNKYIQKLYEKWSNLNGYSLIDLCGGTDKIPGYLNIDLFHGDLKFDLNDTPWPIKDNSVGFIRAFDALEHMKDPIKTMKEIHRILVPGGMLYSRTPSTEGRGAFQDPTHVSFWNSNSFWYYTREDQAKFINKPVRFQDTYIENLYPSDWHKTHLISYTDAHLTALKGGDESSYCPGVIKIKPSQETQDINQLDSVIKKNIKTKPQIIVVDNFYQDPDKVREYALTKNFIENKNYHKGKRTVEQYIPSWIKSEFSRLLGLEVSEFVGATGVFQYCTAQDSIVYHFDEQEYAAMVYLTPNAPVNSGTNTYKSKKTGLLARATTEDSILLNQPISKLNAESFNNNNFYDRNNMELVDTVGNVYNRLVIFNAHLIHSASSYFGTDLNDGRLFHLYFFNCKKI